MLNKKYTINFLIITVILVFGTGCVSGSGGLLTDQFIDDSKSVFIEPIEDASNGEDDTHLGSGDLAGGEFRDQLIKAGIHVNDFSTRDGYTLKARYVQWEDHATNWSGVSDVVEISIELVDNSTYKPIAQARSKVLSTFFTLANHEPKKLIPGAVKRVLKKVYK